MDPRLRYCVELDRIKHLPATLRLRAEYKFFAVMAFLEDFVPKEKVRLGKDFRWKPAGLTFCTSQGISYPTLCDWRKALSQDGIAGLVPHYGPEWEAGSIQRLRAGTMQHRSRGPTSGKTLLLTLRISAKRPLDCLDQLASIVSASKYIEEDTRSRTLKALAHFQKLARRMAPVALPRTLTPEEREALEQYRLSLHKGHSARATGLLMASENHSMVEIMAAVGKTHTAVYGWVRRFGREGISWIETRPRLPERDRLRKERTTRVLAILHNTPAFYGVNRTAWTRDEIRRVYETVHGEVLPHNALTKAIRSSGYQYNKAIRVLVSEDPTYQAKLAYLKGKLEALQPGEAFFFVDEWGPCHVVKIGGRALGPGGEPQKIPARQKSRGKVNLIAALEALSNQVTVRFGGQKDADGFVAFLEELRGIHTEGPKMYLAWDAISIHRSKKVRAWVAVSNLAAATGKGPAVEVVPIPIGSQFLNVIEAVFIGMRKAVVHNSDYSSKEEMEAAIARHFDERNAFFRKNPRRAGNKIWDRQAFQLADMPGWAFGKKSK
jgi:transposase